MSSGRYHAHGAIPEVIYLVTEGTMHRVYSTLASARAVRTYEINNEERWGRQRRNDWKIYKITVGTDNVEEIS